MVSSVSNTSTTPLVQNGKVNGLSSLAENYETFLKLLTEQLKNQDPMQPQDASEFTNQLVQFSQVEQQIASNDKLDNLITSMNANRPVQALSYIGNVVEMSGNALPLQDGVADFSVAIPKKPAEAVVEVQDSTGRAIRTLDLPPRAGFQELRWDGKSAAGVQMKDGFYQVVVKAKDEDGKDMQTIVQTSGRVTGVDMSEGETYLDVGGVAVKLDQVTSVRARRPGG